MIDNLTQSKLRERFNPKGSTLRNHQLRMLEMLKYIDTICKKHDIKYWLCSGTLIGAVRHEGFIPWDDDVDIEMLKEDYEKFVRVMEKEPHTNYALQTHKTDFNYFLPYAKLRDLHSIIHEERNHDSYYKFHGCFIDIFIIEPSSSLFLSRVANTIWKVLLLSSDKLNKHIRKFYYPIAYSFFYYITFPIIKCLSKWNSKGQYRLLGCSYYKPRNIKDIFPLQLLPFEDTNLPVPSNYHHYLQKIYGDYMQLPNLDKLNPHIIDLEIL